MSAIARMAHRGPDDYGLDDYDNESLVFGHRRLAILDLSHAGHQPMSTPDGRYHLTYNGEVYNFATLRRDLEKEGVGFRSNTDTEVVLQLYARHGPEMIHQLRGMFAFAIYDSLERRLFLARDRLGIKPLYTCLDPEGNFWFASEVKALIAAGALRPAVDPHALALLLKHGHVTSPMSLFDGVRKLEPGHTLTVEADGSQELNCYWDVFDGLQWADQGAFASNEEDVYLDELEDVLRESVRMRLVADVPVGTLLSGGVDSSLVTALASQYQEGIQTFSIGYEGHRQYDELDWAHRVASDLGTDHADIWVNAEHVREALPAFLEAQEEPASDPQWLSVYFLSRLAGQHGVTVVLTGDGGDEVFGGYNKWQDYLSAYHRYWLPLTSAPAAVSRVISAGLGPLIGDVPRDMLHRAARGEDFFQGGSIFKHHELRRLLKPEVFDLLVHSQDGDNPNYRQRLDNRYGSRLGLDGPQYLDWMTYVGLKTSVAENFLMRLDKMGMAESREGRVPLLDHQVIAKALEAPPDFRIKTGVGKYPLKKILERYLPAEVVHRPKMGFQSPMGEWMEAGLEEELGDASENLVDLSGLLDLNEANRILRASKGQGRWPSRKWLLVNLALWYRTHIQQVHEPSRHTAGG